MSRRGWSDAQLAHELDIDTGQATRIIYGDRKPGRALTLKFASRLNIAGQFWDEPCAVKVRAHGPRRPSNPPPTKRKAA